MNRLSILLGLLGAALLSCAAFVLLPLIQLGNLQQSVALPDGSTYPNPRSGLAMQGAQVYRANGCVACHTQQVRPASMGSDITRGWGRRRTVARDYLFDSPVMLGSVRIGPDLTNIGMRSDQRTLLALLYAPQLITPGSIMPSYRYLFQTRRVGAGSAADVLPLPGNYAAKPGYEIVPGPDAKALVAYLRSLQIEGFVYEAPATWAKPRTLQSTFGENAPAGTNRASSTNLPSSPAP